MCNVPSTAVFCSEYIECFTGTDSKFFFQTFVTVPVAPIITGIITLLCSALGVSLHTNFCIIIIIIIITYGRLRKEV